MSLSETLEILEYPKVLGFVNKYSVTEGGKNYINSLTPFSGIDYLREGENVSEAKAILINLSDPPLESLPDLTNELNLAKIGGAVLQPQKLLLVLKLARVSRTLQSFLYSSKNDAPELSILSKGLFSDKLFEHHITTILDESGEVKDNASRELQKIRTAIREKQYELQKMVARIAKNLSQEDFLREEYLTLRDGRVVIPIKVEHKRQIRGFIHSESATGQTVYIEPEETLNLNNEIVTLGFAEKREIDRLLKELTAKTGERAEDLIESQRIVSVLDSYFARAKYSIEVRGGFPSFNTHGKLELKDARHPILLQKTGREKTIPLDLEIKDEKIIVITGPNAGGKTVVLKTVGLLSCLAFAGFHIPASPDSSLPYFSGIHVDIGDKQSLEDDLSTFSSHLTNIKNILETADENTLVLLDELGTGTDPSAGSALGIACLLTLRDKGSYVLATTHFGRLKSLSEEFSGIKNSAMEFDTVNLTPTYRFKQGVPGSSYAFEISRRIGFSDDFLSKALSYFNENDSRLETLLVTLERREQELQEKIRYYERENTRLKGLTRLYDENIKKLEKEKNLRLKKAKEEAEAIIKESQKEVQRVIKELRESFREADPEYQKSLIRNAQSALKNLKEKNERMKISDAVEQTSFIFKIGDVVKIKSSSITGKITSIDETKNEAGIQAGNLKIKASLNDLEPDDKRAKTETVHFHSVNDDVKFRMDIRGEKPENINFEVIRFIDSAYSGGMDKIEILHGKGNGVLKRMVKEILDNHPGVRRYYFAPVEIGGEGITIIEFKN